jgi:hypothetical protein
MWQEILDPVDHAEFQLLLDGKPVGKEFEEWFERGEVLQELFEVEMRNDELGLLIQTWGYVWDDFT